MSPLYLYLHLELLWSYIKTKVSTGMIDEKVTVILLVVHHVLVDEIVTVILSILPYDTSCTYQEAKMEVGNWDQSEKWTCANFFVTLKLGYLSCTW